MTFDPAQKVAVKVEIYTPTLGWVDVTTRGRAASKVHISQGPTPGAIQAETARLECALGNADGYLTEGNPGSPWYPYVGRGLPVRISLVGVLGTDAQRFSGSINTLRAVYPGGSDSTVEITAIGRLGAVGQGSDPLDSPLFRAIPGLSPVAYWALEDGTTATLGASAVAGVDPLRAVGQVRFGSDDGCAGSDKLPNFTGGGQLLADLPSTGSSTSWRVECVARFGTGSDSITGGQFAIALHWDTVGGTLGGWELTADATEAYVQWVSTDGSRSNIIASNFSVADGLWHHFRVECVQSGADVITTLTIDGIAFTSTFAADTIGRITNIIVNYINPVAAYAPSVGHLAIWAPYAPAAPLDTALVARGWAGETAHARMIRICTEEGIPYSITSTVSPAMGAQPLATVFDILDECHVVGQGLLHDASTDGAITYIATDNLTNLSASLAITTDIVAAGGLVPRWDYQDVYNDVTSTRPGGASVHVSDEAHVAAINRRAKGAPRPNVQLDAELGDDAGWRVRVGTAAGPRYESIPINMRNLAAAALATTIINLAIGNRLTVAQAVLPASHPPGGIDVLIVGWDEILDADTWIIAFRGVPYAPYRVGILAATSGDTDPLLGWLSADTCTVHTAVTSATSTSWSVDSTPLWTTTADDFPCDVVVDGEVVRITDVAGGANPQTWTVTRNINGFARTHAAGASIDLLNPIVLAL